MRYKNLFHGIFFNRRVLITGNTGFKGSWLDFWLNKMGAITLGFSLKPHTIPDHFNLLSFKKNTIIGNISNYSILFKTIVDFNPEIIFHLAAQPLVSVSYKQPVETIQTNIVGTSNLLEACRNVKSIQAIVVITSDKCYDNKEKEAGYIETDSLGGHDIYSATKACAEIITNAYRKSFFSSSNVLIATARAGNVIGGGDWSNDRLIPDIIKSVYEPSELIIRNLSAIRPWQHVLDSLCGYLLLGQKLLERNYEFADAWNFGPDTNAELSVMDILEIAKSYWSDFKFKTLDYVPFQETKVLKLDASKAREKLYWNNLWNVEKTFRITFNWYKYFYEKGIVHTEKDLELYIADAKKQNTCWV